MSIGLLCFANAVELAGVIQFVAELEESGNHGLLLPRSVHLSNDPLIIAEAEIKCTTRAMVQVKVLSTGV